MPHVGIFLLPPEVLTNLRWLNVCRRVEDTRGCSVRTVECGRPTFPRAFRLWLGMVVFFASGSWVESRAVDLSGTYEDCGMVISGPGGDSPSAVSLSALLVLDFKRIPAPVHVSEVAKTIIRQFAEWLDVETQDGDGNIIWHSRWHKDRGALFASDKVVLLLHSPQSGDDRYILTLRKSTEHPALLVDVQCVKATLFGPAVRPPSTYLFAAY